MKDVQHSAPNLAISACGKAQQWDLALSVFESANTFKIEPSIITLNVAISACEKKNQWQGAWNLLGSGRAAALEVSVVTRNAMLSAFGKGAQWQRALFLLRAEDMPTPDILSFNAAIAACERGKKWQEALCLLREVEDLSCPDVITYNSAISSLRETTGLCRGRRTSLNMSSTNHRFLGEASGPRDQPRAANVWSWGSECLGVFFFLPSEASMKHHFKESDGSGASASGSPSGSRSGWPAFQWVLQTVRVEFQQAGPRWSSGETRDVFSSFGLLVFLRIVAWRGIALRLPNRSIGLMGSGAKGIRQDAGFTGFTLVEPTNESCGTAQRKLSGDDPKPNT